MSCIFYCYNSLDIFYSYGVLCLLRYESVNPDVLFAAFENTISEYQYDFGKNITVTDFMKQWTEQAGYPMVSVIKINDVFVITQVNEFKLEKFE